MPGSSVASTGPESSDARTRELLGFFYCSSRFYGYISCFMSQSRRRAECAWS